MRLSDQVRDTLAGLLRDGNREKALRPRRLEGLLKDMCPGSRAEVHVLLCGLRAGIPAELLANGAHDLDGVLAQLVARLGEWYGIDPAAAGWGVEAWALALGVMRPDELGQRVWPSEDDEPLDQRPKLAKTWDRATHILVAADGSGDFRSLQEALDLGDPEKKVVVKPGLYREFIQLKRPVEVIGDGDPAEIVIESTHRHALVMEAEWAAIEGVSFRAITTSAAQPFHAVVVAGGQLRMVGCRLASSGQAAVVVQGRGVSPHFISCGIGDGPGRGVVCREMSSPVFTDCDIFGHSAACVDVREWAEPQFQRCRIHGSRVNGVVVTECGAGHFTECDLFDHWLSAVVIQSGGNPVLERCRIHRARAHGVWIGDKGEGTVRNCEIFDNGRGAIFVETGCRPRLTANEVRT